MHIHHMHRQHVDEEVSAGSQHKGEHDMSQQGTGDHAAHALPWARGSVVTNAWQTPFLLNWLTSQRIHDKARAKELPSRDTRRLCIVYEFFLAATALYVFFALVFFTWAASDDTPVSFALRSGSLTSPVTPALPSSPVTSAAAGPQAHFGGGMEQQAREINPLSCEPAKEGDTNTRRCESFCSGEENLAKFHCSLCKCKACPVCVRLGLHGEQVSA